MILPLWLLPIMVATLCVFGLLGAAWCCLVLAARADREAAHQQELRDIDAWLEAMWRA